MSLKTRTLFRGRVASHVALTAPDHPLSLFSFCHLRNVRFLFEIESSSLLSPVVIQKERWLRRVDGTTNRMNPNPTPGFYAFSLGGDLRVGATTSSDNGVMSMRGIHIEGRLKLTSSSKAPTETLPIVAIGHLSELLRPVPADTVLGRDLIMKAVYAAKNISVERGRTADEY
jgi:hypothetical protein